VLRVFLVGILLVGGLQASGQSCRGCHAAETDSFERTAHYLTSRAPDAQSILGNFTAGENILKTVNPNLYFRMEAHNGAFTQTAVAGTNLRTERIAVVVGSGEKGQTYLFWDGDQLFELPVSYWTQLGWVNSPGYRDGFADFERPITPRCMECHATAIKMTPPPANSYSPTSLVYGIQCEKCHGPSAAHAASPRAAILNPAHFSRDRQMDLCAWCHAGHGQALQVSFLYKPGEPLDQYIHFAPHDPSAPLDVHGNQVEMLKMSRCFRESQMTCLTCHNVHVPQHDLAEFSRRCLSCHKPDSATFARSDHKLTANCIDCHMPRQETNLIVFNTDGKQAKPLVRNHWIKVY
jgi:hypothetical protein